MARTRVRRLIIGLAALVAATRLAGGPLVAQEVECPGLDYDARSGIAGRVREAGSEVTIPRARVVATWTTVSGGRGSLGGESDKDGVYVLCGLPTNTSIVIQAAFADFVTDPVRVRVEPGRPAGWDFTITIETTATRGSLAFPGRIVGRITDGRSRRAVDGAAVTLVGDDETRLSDGGGRYMFRNLAPGVYRIAIQHLAYEPVEQFVNVPGNRTVEVNFALSADPIELEPLVVTIIRNRRLELKGYYDRREIGERIGAGVFFDQAEIRRKNAIRVTHLLNQVSGIRIDCSGPTQRNCRIVMTRGSPSLSSRGQSGCVNSNVYVDGVRVIRDTQDSPESIDSFVSPSEIVGMEIYRGPSELPAEFGGSFGRCGAIVIWTGSGR